MKITLGFSTCPNDTFIFDALVNNKIDTEDLEFDIKYADIEQLNLWALQGKLEVTKLSYYAYSFCSKDYVILDSGSALGRRCGPLLIQREGSEFDIKNKIAIPGRYTTANMLLDIMYPGCYNKVEAVFSDIEKMVLNKEADSGLIIHENRFTYKEKGLVKIIDLGKFWEDKTSLPIPLGGIVVKNNMSHEIKKKVSRVLRRSVVYAMNNPQDSFEYIQSYSQEKDKNIIESHINLYVNDFTISLEDEGVDAIEKMFGLLGVDSSGIFFKT